MYALHEALAIAGILVFGLVASLVVVCVARHQEYLDKGTAYEVGISGIASVLTAVSVIISASKLG